MVINPSAPNIIFVGNYKSVDSGVTWVGSTNGINPPDISNLAFDPINSNVAIAGNSVGIYRSEDTGSTWTLVKEITGVTSLTFDPDNSNVIYAGTQSGLLNSMDNGNTWDTPDANSDAAALNNVSSMAISSGPTKTIFAGSSSLGLFKSTNQDGRWNLVNSGPILSGAGHTFVAISPSQSNYLYAGIINGYRYGTKASLFASVNSGRSWTSIDTKFGLCGFTIDPKSPLTLYATTQQGIQKSLDGGVTWNLIYSGSPNDGFSNIIVDPQNSATIYANLGPSGISKSVDSGQTWRIVRADPNNLSLFINPLKPNSIYAGGYGFIFYSPDGGDNWTRIRVGSSFMFPAITSIVFDPKIPDLIYAGSSTGHFTSVDNGATWTGSVGADPVFWINGLAQDPTVSKTLYAATIDGIFKTLDGFVTSQKINKGLPDAVPFSSVIVNPANNSTLYSTIDNGFIFTTDPAAAGVPTPSSGWWWNPAEPGRGYGLEISSSGAMRLGLFGFDDSGFSHWWTASGTLDSAGNFSSNLIDAEFGNPLGAPQRAAQTSSVGSISFAATSDTAGTLTLPNGSQVPIQRYEFTPGGLGAAPDAAAPKTGWWASPNAPGQYFFIEVQNGVINASVLSFDVDGGPVWYSDQTSSVASGTYGGSWQELIGGQTLTSPYRAPKALSIAASASLRFSTPTSGSLIFGTTILPISWTGP